MDEAFELIAVTRKHIKCLALDEAAFRTYQPFTADFSLFCSRRVNTFFTLSSSVCFIFHGIASDADASKNYLPNVALSWEQGVINH